MIKKHAMMMQINQILSVGLMNSSSIQLKHKDTLLRCFVVSRRYYELRVWNDWRVVLNSGLLVSHQGYFELLYVVLASSYSKQTIRHL